MRRSERLRRSQDIDAVFREGRVLSNNLLVLRARPNQLGYNRYGFSVGKRTGTAVTRNLIKRRLRAAARQLAPAGTSDIVLIARAPIRDAGYDEIVAALTSLLRRARMLPDDGADGSRTGMGATAPPDAPPVPATGHTRPRRRGGRHS